MGFAKLLSGRVAKVTGSDLSTERYNYIDVAESEPDFGFPSADNGIFSSRLTGERRFLFPSTGLVVDNVTGNITVDFTTTGNEAFSTVEVVDTDSGYTWAETGTVSADTSADTLQFVSGTYINVDADATNDAIRFTHIDTTRTDTTSTATPVYGGTFDVIDSVTSNTTGHITAVNVKTVTLPASDDTTYTISTEPGANANEEIIRLTDSNAVTDDIILAVAQTGATDGLTISETGDTITFAHADTSTLSGAQGTAGIASITVDEMGHVTAVTTATYDNYVSWTISDGTTTQEITSGNTLTVVDGTDIDAVISATDTLTINNTSTLDSVTGRGNTTTNDITVNNMIVSGDLTVNGTTTTVNSTTVTIDDPIFTLGGDTAPATDDNKDRGVEFRWHDGIDAKVGFFGFDDSTGKWTFIPDATNTSEVFSGTTGELDAKIDWNNILNIPTTATSNDFGTITVVDADSGYTWSETGSTSASTSGDTLTFVSGTYLDVDVDTTNDAIRFTHIDTTRTDTTSTQNPVYGDTIDVIDSVTSNTQGHVTAVNVKTITLPASDDTTYSLSTEPGANANEEIIRLTSNAAITDDIVLAVAQVDTTDGLTISEAGDTITFAHANTSSQASVDNSGNTFVQDVTLDTYGHITGLASAAIDFNVADNYAFKSITDGTNTAVADSNTDTFKIRVQDQIEATVVSDDATHGDSVLFGHTDSGVVADTYGSTTAIPVITVDAQGHITSATTSAISTTWIISDGTTTQDINGGDTLLATGGTYITTTVSATDTLTITHDNTTRTDTTSNESPVYGGSFDVIDSVTSNTTGHVTAINLKTVTLPASDNTDVLQDINLDSTDATQYITFVANTSGAQTGRVDTDLTYNPSSNLLTTGNLTVSGNALVEGNLTVNGTTTTVNATNLSIGDNMIYLNSAGTATISNATGDGSTITFTTVDPHTFSSGYTVDVSGVDPAGYNVTDATITVTGANTFTVSGTETGAYVSGGEAEAHSNTNVDLGWAGSYDDGTYAHAGLFRDATDGIFKVFDSYTPEPYDAVDIDTSDPSFNIAPFQAAAITATSLNTHTIPGGTGTLALTSDIGDGTITVTAGTDLATGGSFTTNQSGNTTVTLDHATITRTDTTSTATPVYGGTFDVVDSVTSSATGHITAVNVKTVTLPASDNTTYSLSTEPGANANEEIIRLTDSNAVTDDIVLAVAQTGTTDGLTISETGDTITFAHADTSTLSGAQGTAGIASITVDEMGHVTAVTTATYDAYVSWTLAADTGTSETIESGDTVTVAGGDAINTVVSATDTVTINHDTIIRTDTTSSSTPAFGGTVDIIDSITTNVQGHVTAINVNTVTLPEEADTLDSVTSRGNTTTNNITVNDITVSGNLTVNGTTTTVNSTTVTVDDPIFTLGGDTAPVADDNKDRGVEFRWHDGVNAKVGYFGFDDSTGKWTFIPDATNTSEVFSGTTGELDAKLDWSNLLNIPAGGGSDTTYTISAESPSGNAVLRLTGSDTTTDDVAFVGSGNTTVTRTDENTITISSSDTSNSLGSIEVTDTDSGYTWAETGTVTAGGVSSVFKFVSGTYIDVDADDNNDAIRFSHENSGVTADTYGSGTAVPVITVDAQGHITSATTSTINTTWTISDGTTTQDINGGDTLTIVDGTDINAVVSATDTLTINNTSTLDSVTGRGATTTNGIGVDTLQIDSSYLLNYGTTTLATTTLSAIDLYSATTYGGAKIVVQAYDTVTGERHMSELLIVHDGTTASATEYAVIYTGAAALATYDVDISGGNVRLLISSASTNSTEYKVAETTMLA